jgi:4-amino-4-deoxy-L-arabinose transferase-like glycosyltransferase
MNSKLVFCIALLVVALLAAALRLETVSVRPLWGDEIASKKLATRGSLAEVVAASRTELLGSTAPLHGVLMHLHLPTEPSRLSLRLTSVETGLLTVIAVAGLGALLFGHAVGIVAALLLSVCVYHIEYSQDARPYALLLLLLCATAYCLFSFLATNHRRWLIGFAVSGAAALHTHHLAAIYQLAFSAILAFVLLRRYFRERSEGGGARSFMSVVNPLIGSHLLIVFLYLPTLPQAINMATRIASVPSDHTLHLSVRFFWELLGRWGNGTPWSAVYALLLLTGVATVVRRRDVTLALLVWLAAPFVFYATVPFRSFFDIRYVMGALPPFILLVAVGVVSTGAFVARVVARRREFAELLGGRLPEALAGTLTAFLVILSLLTYIQFRETRFRCSDFFRQAEIMELDDGFCRQYLILNTLYRPHAFMLRKQ